MFGINKTYLYLYLVLFSGLLTYFSQQYILTNEILIEHFSEQMSFSRIGDMLDSRNERAWLGYVFLPITYLVKFSLISLWILCGTIIFRYQVTFKQIFQVVIVAESVWVIRRLLAVVWFGFIQTDYTLAEVQMFQPFSLLSLFDPDALDAWVIFPLKAINIFEVIYLIVLTIGMARVIKKPVPKTLSFSVPVYGSALLTWIIFITFLTINLT